MRSQNASIRRFRFLVLVAIFTRYCLAGQIAFATERFYPDLKAESANGLYRVEAKSPDNIREFAAFQKNFKYTLTHIPSGRQLWEWTPEAEPSPRSLNVHDAGTVVVWDAFDRFSTIDLHGKAKSILSLNEYIPKLEYDKWVHRTTAGPIWAGCSLWYFCEVDDEHYFIVRTYWNRRIVINLTSQSAVSNSSHLDRHFLAAEKRSVMKTLRAGSAKRFATNPDKSIDYEILTAAFVAGKLSIPEVIPFLKELEVATNRSDRSCISGDSSWEVNRPRQIAQLSLRRLGITPQGYPVIFVKFDESESIWNVPWPVGKPTRSDKARNLEAGWSSQKIVETIGSPDYVESWHVSDLDSDDDVWEYDMDAAEPYSLRLILREGKLLKVIKLAPLWRQTGFRDEFVAS